jgi:hypothetical protein
MGDISSLGATIGDKHEFGHVSTDEDYVDIGGTVSVHKQCTFYTRDREEDTTWKSFSTVDAWMEHYEESWCEYFYLFEGGQWMYCTRGDDTFQPVVDGLANSKVEEAV